MTTTGGGVTGVVDASPVTVTVAEAIPIEAPVAPAMATARVLLPLKGVALLIGMAKLLEAPSPAFHVNFPLVAV